MNERERGRSAPHAREDVVFRTLSDEWVLYDPRTRDLHVLNVTAAAVWTCCDGTMAPSDIARVLSEELENVPARDVVRRDVEGALERFRAAGLFQ